MSAVVNCVATIHTSNVGPIVKETCLSKMPVMQGKELLQTTGQSGWRVLPVSNTLLYIIVAHIYSNVVQYGSAVWKVEGVLQMTCTLYEHIARNDDSDNVKERMSEPSLLGDPLEGQW